MTFFVEVPTPESIDESVPPSDTWERFYALNTEWHLEEYGHTDQLANTLTEFRHSFTVPYTSVWISRYFLIVSGQTLPGKRPNFDQVPAENVVGLLVFTRSAGADSPNFFHNLYITASARRQGFGSEGLAWLREMALSESCTRAETWVIARQLESSEGASGELDQSAGEGLLRTSPGFHFAQKHNYMLGIVEHSSTLMLERESLEALLTHYHSQTGPSFAIEHSGTTGFDWEELAAINTEFAQDVPDSEGAAPPTYSAQDVENSYRERVERGFRMASVTIRHAPDGRAVAFTQVLFREGATTAHQALSWVSRQYRGQHLSGLAKVALYLDLLNKGLKQIETENASQNAAILATNKRIGFQTSGCEGGFVSTYRDGHWVASGV